MNVSVIIPVYNEEKTITTVIKKLQELNIPQVYIEIIIVDDASTDATISKIKKSKLNRNVSIFNHKKNQGKGAAIRTGIKNAKGDYILIQDADLEYNPSDIPKLLKPIIQKKAQVVYGTRLDRLPNFKRDERTFRFLLHYMGNKLLSLITSIFYGQWITDMETCYKIFPKSAIMNINLTSRGFEFEPEITSILLKKGFKIFEVPISTNPRGYDEGKKLNTFKDGFIALWTLFKLRLTP